MAESADFPPISLKCRPTRKTRRIQAFANRNAALTIIAVRPFWRLRTRRRLPIRPRIYPFVNAVMGLSQQDRSPVDCIYESECASRNSRKEYSLIRERTRTALAIAYRERGLGWRPCVRMREHRQASVRLAGCRAPSDGHARRTLSGLVALRTSVQRHRVGRRRRNGRQRRRGRRFRTLSCGSGNSS